MIHCFNAGQKCCSGIAALAAFGNFQYCEMFRREVSLLGLGQGSVMLAELHVKPAVVAL